MFTKVREKLVCDLHFNFLVLVYRVKLCQSIRLASDMRQYSRKLRLVYSKWNITYLFIT